MLQDAFGERGGTFQAVTERDIRVRNSLSRLEQLEIGRESLVFGRIDRAGSTTGPPNGAEADTEAFHIGRLAISDATRSRWSSTGGPRSPSPSTGPPAPTPWVSPAAATS